MERSIEIAKCTSARGSGFGRKEIQVLIPKTIFKYEPMTLRSVTNVKSHALYFGSPKQFNDPYDCTISVKMKKLSDLEVNAIASKWLSDPTTPLQGKEELADMTIDQQRAMFERCAEGAIQVQSQDFLLRRGITCFSEVNDNLLMWSHYGSQHRGFCLEFRTEFPPFTHLRPVYYSATIPEVDIARFMIYGDYDRLIDRFCTKSIDWQYEREWRVIHGNVGTVFTYDAKALKAIYFGSKMTEEDMDLICLLLHGLNPDVELYQGERSTSEYKIVFKRFTYTSYLEAKKAGLLPSPPPSPAPPPQAA